MESKNETCNCKTKQNDKENHRGDMADKGSTHARRTHGPPCQPWKLQTRPTSKMNRRSWLNAISRLVSAHHSRVPNWQYIFWTLSVSLRIFLYLFVSLCIFLYLYVSLRIFTYLYVSLCIFLFLTYLYVSLCIFQNRSGRYVRIFTYLYVSFEPVSKDT